MFRNCRGMRLPNTDQAAFLPVKLPAFSRAGAGIGARMRQSCGTPWSLPPTVSPTRIFVILSHNHSHGKDGSERKPYYWETHTPAECRQIEAVARAWFDREMEALRERKKAEKAARKRARDSQPQLVPQLDPLPAWPTETPEQYRERKRGERFAAFVLRFAPHLKPVLLKILAREIGKLMAEVKCG
jgi:hypothetical protein